MNIYYVNTLNGALGYVCADDAEGAITLAAEALGFSGVKDYASNYPGCWENTSVLRGVVEKDRVYEDFIKHRESLGDILILHVIDVSGLLYAMDIRHSATHLIEEKHSGFQSKTILAPKINDVMGSDIVFDKYSPEDMWYCEDWQEQ